MPPATGVAQVAVETTQTFGDANLGVEDENCALIEPNAGEIERGHRVL